MDGFENIDDRTGKYHHDSLAPLSAAVFAVQPFISEASFQKLHNLWQEYKTGNFDCRTVLEYRTAHELKYGHDAPDLPPYAKDKLKDHMKKFRNVVG